MFRWMETWQKQGLCQLRPCKWMFLCARRLIRKLERMKRIVEVAGVQGRS
uniref:Uncharacterized protein n=1 Tax=Arundo donax TaxID=35708 RepID=A0A0A9DSF5_ARUDO